MLDEEIRQEYAWTHPHLLPQHNNLLTHPIADILTRYTREKNCGWNRFIRLAMHIMQLQIMIEESGNLSRARER